VLSLICPHKEYDESCQKTRKIKTEGLLNVEGCPGARGEVMEHWFYEEGLCLRI